MSTIQQNTTTTTTLNDGTQIKSNEYLKQSNPNELNEKPEFDYNRPAQASLKDENITTGGSAISGTNASTNQTYEPRIGTTTTSQPQMSTSESLKQKAVQFGHSIEQAVNSASHSINNAISGYRTSHQQQSQPTTTTTNTATYNTAAPGSEYNPNIPQTQTQHHQQQQQSKGGFGAKLNDMMAHVGAALHQGHPVHAVTNATTAAKIGECERLKHEHGPLVESGETNPSSLNNPNYNAAGQPYDNTSSAALHHPKQSTYSQPTTTTYNQSTAQSNLSGEYTTKEKLQDMASHASAQLSHGNPLTAISDAPAAARIAEAEKMKHQKGPIGSAPESDTAGLVSGQSNLSSNSGSVGGATGISGRGGASTINY